LAIETGETVEYVITGSDRLVLFDIHEAGDPLVVKIVAPKEIDQNDLVFKITGAGPGTTEFRVYWEGPDRGDICKVKIIVSG